MISLRKIQPLLFAIIFAMVTGGGVVWLWIGVDMFGDRLVERIETIENQQVFDSQYDELILMVEETTPDREKLETFILESDEDTIVLLSKLDEIALAQGVALATQQLDVVEKSGNFNSLALSLVISGREEVVRKMVSMLEKLPYHGRVTSLSYKRSRFEDGSVEVDASIALLLSIKKYDR